ncbi:MipA/OmpV family protein [Wenxinia saemankumensis]|nr:MipA/OmpV family protein [Wenxinia saemankumensis]
MIRPILLAALVLPAAAGAQETGNRIVFQLGGGAASVPGYFGSPETEIVPDLAFSFAYARLGGFEFGDPDPYARASGLGFGASFRVVPERTARDYPELAGLDDLEQAVELGGQVSYAGPGFEAFAALRYGVTGHEALVGEVGLDAVLRPQEDLELTLGPRVVYGSDDYADYYFGISAAEAAASGVDAFAAGAGIVSAGIAFGMEYRLAPAWSLYGTARYDQLQGDAADSPITFDDEQVSVSLGITRTFDLRF